jgi:hypothetical protein
MHNFWLRFSAPEGRLPRMGRANHDAPLFSVVVVSAPHLIRTTHPSGSRRREQLSRDFPGQCRPPVSLG